MRGLLSLLVAAAAASSVRITTAPARAPAVGAIRPAVASPAPVANQIQQPDSILAKDPPPAAEESRQVLWPSVLLLGCSVLYGTNFALGRLMNDALPAAATTSARMLLAAGALSPFLRDLNPSLRGQAALCGSFTALGYISQSIALDDTPAATVAFLGATTVVICPALSAIFNGRKLGFADAPQTWLAAALTLVGVGLLELGGGDGAGLALEIHAGDVWSVLQAVGFGTSFYLTERMMSKDPSQAMPITAMQCAMSAAYAAVWALADGGGLMHSAQSMLSGAGEAAAASGGWLLDEATRATHTLPGLLLDEGMRPVAAAALWTGLVTTAANRVGETNALGKLSSSEASVLLATEPFWAALFAALLLGEALDAADFAGGALIVGACLCNAQDADSMRRLLGMAPPPLEPELQPVGAEPAPELQAIATEETTGVVQPIAGVGCFVADAVEDEAELQA